MEPAKIKTEADIKSEKLKVQRLSEEECARCLREGLNPADLLPPDTTKHRATFARPLKWFEADVLRLHQIVLEVD